MKLRYYLILIFFMLALTPVLLFRAWPYSSVIEQEVASVEEFQQRAKDARESAFFMVLIGVANALALALLSSIVTVRQLESLTGAARNVSGGDFTVPEKLRYAAFVPLELRDLHAGFREMVLRLRQSQGRIHKLAFFDSTTGLANRECFRRRVQAFFDQASPEDNAALLFMDLDGFKAVNDTMGHEVGDDVLGQVGARLKLVVGDPELMPDEPILKGHISTPSVARLGGDEFAIFLPHADVGTALTLAEHVREKIEVPFPHARRLLTLGASVGIACAPDNAIDFSGLLKAADIAMYDAKRNGKNRASIFNAAPTVLRDRRFEMAEDLFSAEIPQQINMHFQPYYRANDLMIAGVEGLIRWQHPKYGLLTPRSFFQMVAQLGLQRRIDLLAFDRSIEAMSDIARDGAKINELSLNIPVDRLLDEPFVSRVLQVQPLPFALNFELLETSYSDASIERAHWAIDRLKDAGVRFEMDDFGSPQASLAAMLDLAPHRIKLDSRLTAGVAENAGIATLVTSLVEMAHELEIGVVAKSVETMDQAEKLRQLGADYLQGFILNRPLSPEELVTHLADPKAAIVA